MCLLVKVLSLFYLSKKKSLIAILFSSVFCFLIFLGNERTKSNGPDCRRRWRRRWSSGNRWSWKRWRIGGACLLGVGWWLCNLASSTASANPPLARSLLRTLPSACTTRSTWNNREIEGADEIKLNHQLPNYCRGYIYIYIFSFSNWIEKKVY